LVIPLGFTRSESSLTSGYLSHVISSIYVIATNMEYLLFALLVSHACCSRSC
jgi:hypothetical protein